MSMNGVLTSMIRLLSSRVCKSGETSGKISPNTDSASSDVMTDKKTASANSMVMNQSTVSFTSDLKEEEIEIV